MTTAWIPQQNAVWARQVFEDLKSRGLDGGAAVSGSGINRAALFRKGGTIPFEIGSIVEAAFLVEMVVDRCVDGSKFL